MAIKLTRMDGGTVDLSPEVLQSFKAAFRGQVLTADDLQYEESRQIWTGLGVAADHPAVPSRDDARADNQV